MNDTMIENILLQAPRPAAPADLLNKLKAEIALPARKVLTESREWRNPLRRWFPALAFGVLMLSCAIMIAVQASWSTNLKRENEALRATAAELPQLRERHAALEQAQANHDELVQLRKDNAELHQLQKEVAQLRNLSGEIQRLRNENQRLAANPSPNTSATTSANFFQDAQADAERIQCVNNLKQIGLAMRVWEGDNNDKYPPSILLASNELSTTKVLVCPSDKARQPYATLGFGKFQESMTSYQFTVLPDSEIYPESFTAKCPIHHNYLMADGSVQMVNPDKIREVNIDGRWYLRPINDPYFQQQTVAPIK
jgi:hypothetical protein